MSFHMDEYVKLDVALDYLAMHWSPESKVKFHRLGPGLSSQKLLRVQDMADADSSREHVFGAKVTDMDHILLKHFKRHKMLVNQDLFIMSKHYLGFVATRDMTFKLFVDELDNIVPRSQDHECLVCFGKEKLFSCVRCTAMYCDKCMSRKVFKCHVCNVEAKMLVNKKGRHCCLPMPGLISLKLGCMLKVLEHHHGLQTQHLFQATSIKPYFELILSDFESNHMNKYMDVQAFTAFMHVLCDEFTTGKLHVSRKASAMSKVWSSHPRAGLPRGEQSI